LIFFSVPVIELTPDTFTVYVKELVSIRCEKIRNDKENDQLFWEKVDEHEKNKLTIREKKKDRFDLEIDPPCLTILDAEMSDSGYYYCCIEYSTSDGKKTVKSQKAQLIIRESRHIL
jgi:hypothetical protein